MINYKGHIIIKKDGFNYTISGGFGRKRRSPCFGDITYNTLFNTGGLCKTKSGEFTLYTNTTDCKIKKEELIIYLDQVKKIVPFKYNIVYKKNYIEENGISIKILFGSINRLQFLALSTLVRLVHEYPFNYIVRDYIYLRRKPGFIKLGFINTLYIISCAYSDYNSNHFIFVPISDIFSCKLAQPIKDLEYKKILKSSKSNRDKLNNSVYYINLGKQKIKLNTVHYRENLDEIREDDRYKHVHLPNLKLIKNYYKKYKNKNEKK